MIPFLFSHALDIATVNQANYQIAQNLFADQYAQYFACEATYFGSPDRLVINQNWVGANFNPYYTDVLPQLQTIFSNTLGLTNTAEHAMAEVVWVLTFICESRRITGALSPISRPVPVETLGSLLRSAG